MTKVRAGEARALPGGDAANEPSPRPAVDILLATYNGARFLGAQLSSILNQTHLDWSIIARDDGSSDESVEILETFASQHPGRLRLVADGEGRLGVRGNFGRLLEEADADYVAFCDQDDLWHPRRLEVGLAHLRELERAHGRATPILVFSDLTVVDERLRVIAPSFWRYAGLSPLNIGWRHLLTEDPVTGCTALFNRALRDLAVPIPVEAVAHDWWVALVAALLGRVSPIRVATVMYRQHGSNTIGARPNSFRQVLGRAPRLWRRDEFVHHLTASQRQAGAILQRYGPSLPAEIQGTVAGYASLEDMSFIGRRLFLLRHRIFRQGWIRTAAFLARV